MRMGIPSKGRMAEDTLELLKRCQLKCEKPNPRQYFGEIGQFPDVEVWFQRASDVVRKLRTGDLDIGIVGLDMFSEFAEEDTDLVVIHDALDFGQCKLALGVPTGGAFADVQTLDDLKGLGWSEANPLRVVTGYTNIARRCALRSWTCGVSTPWPCELACVPYLAIASASNCQQDQTRKTRECRYFREVGLHNVVLLSADGALEAAPAMGAADIILDLVSTGVTLRENNLKQIEGGDILDVRSLCPCLCARPRRRRPPCSHTMPLAALAAVAARTHTHSLA